MTPLCWAPGCVQILSGAPHKMWESRLSGSERGRVATRTTSEILWHRQETRRQTENTNVALPFGECAAYLKPRHRVWPRHRTLGEKSLDD